MVTLGFTFDKMRVALSLVMLILPDVVNGVVPVIL